MKSKFLTQSFGLGFLIILFLLLFGCQTLAVKSVKANVPSGWSKAKKAFERLLRETSTLTAREFYFSISDGKGIKGDKTEILDHIFVPYRDYFSADRYMIIAIEMLNRDIYAARSAIVLLDFVDNGWQKPPSLPTRAAGWVGESLGDLIRVNPALFLRACYAERENPYLKEKGFPVGFIPPIMDKKKTRASYELEMRREALRSVGDAELRSVRDECIGAIDRELGKYRLDNVSFMEQKERTFDDPKAKIRYVFAEMKSRPSPENMKRVLDLFPDVPGSTPADVIGAIFPPYEVYIRTPDDPLGPILHEARCGNEYAIEVLFRAMVHVFGFQSEQICDELSNLILMKPALFIERLAKYAQLLDSNDSIRVQDRVIPLYHIEWICLSISSFDYPYQKEIENVILRRMIDALAALDMPEHKELIDRCIRVIEKNMK